jgi:thiol-disulfide isomerase/thioredoxin
MGLILAVLLALAALMSAVQPPQKWGDGYDFQATELRSGKLASRESLTGGSALVLLVWSPDCPHCLTHMPYVAALLKKLDSSRAAFATASLDGKAEDALDYLNGKDLDWPVLFGDEGKFDDVYYDSGWPTTYVFAKGGKYIGYCDTSGPNYITDMLDLVDAARK